MPNLFSALPVVILWWVLASTSGLTRTATSTVRPLAAAISEMSGDLRLRLDVEAEDAGVDGEGDLARRLADAGKDDPFRRAAGGERPAELALRDHVAPRPLGDEGADHRLVGVRLHGVADQRVEAGEGLAEDAVVADEGGGRIAVERRADRRRDVRQGHVLGVEHAVAVVEVIHGSPVLEQEVEREALVGLVGVVGVFAGFRGRDIGLRWRLERPFPAASAQPDSRNQDGRERGAKNDPTIVKRHGRTPSFSPGTGASPASADDAASS